MDLYGGVQTQNVVSHVCREIQANALMALENHGYPIVMHTHDEQVADVPYGRGSVAEYMQIVRASIPEFARSWPISIPDAWEAHRNGKWED